MLYNLCLYNANILIYVRGHTFHPKGPLQLNYLHIYLFMNTRTGNEHIFYLYWNSCTSLPMLYVLSALRIYHYLHVCISHR